MTPLRVQARIAGAIALPNGPIALDSLLASQVAMRDGITPCTSPAEVVQIEIPVQREPQGRFHLASCSVAQIERHRNRYVNRRYPVEEAQMMGQGIKRLGISGGPAKSYRLPLDTVHLVGDMLTWWCIGVEGDVRELVETVPGLGKKRSVGLGRVVEWIVAPCDTWPGFPVVRDGRPLRTLPLDWPGLVQYEVAYANLTYPYPPALNPNEQPCAVMEWEE